MATEHGHGTVKRYDSAKGVGLISRPNGPDVSFDRNALRAGNLQGLAEGDRVEFDFMATPTGPQATLIKLA